MTAPHLQQVDLNLLVALEALLRERHVTRAAEAIGMTQSGMSRALSRLRVQFDDPLLVKGRGGLRPTPRAEGLAAPLSRALGEVRGMMQAQSFDPALATGALRIGMPDHLALLFAPHLLALMRERAPALELLVRAFSRDWQRELRDGEVDLTFGVLRGDEAHLRSRALLSDPWVVLLRDGHPALKRRWTPEAFAALEHGLMTVRGTGPSHVDRALARRRALLEQFADGGPSAGDLKASWIAYPEYWAA